MRPAASKAPQSNLKTHEVVQLVDKNSRTMVKILELMEISQHGPADADPHLLVGRRIEKLKRRLNRRLLKLAKWSDMPQEERQPRERPAMLRPMGMPTAPTSVPAAAGQFYRPPTGPPSQFSMQQNMLVAAGRPSTYPAPLPLPSSQQQQQHRGVPMRPAQGGTPAPLPLPFPLPATSSSSAASGTSFPWSVPAPPAAASSTSSNSGLSIPFDARKNILDSIENMKKEALRKAAESLAAAASKRAAE